MSRTGSIRLFALLCSAAAVLHAQTPEWIWGAKPQDGEKRSFLKEFVVPAGIERAVLPVAADNRAQVLLDGKPIGSSESWSQPTRLRIPLLPAGSHRLEIEAGNEDGAAGLLVRLELHAAGSGPLGSESQGSGLRARPSQRRRRLPDLFASGTHRFRRRVLFPAAVQAADAARHRIGMPAAARRGRCPR
jgi:hypothetical protein